MKSHSKAIRDLSIANDKVQNLQASLENLVEKYLPLRVLNMIVEVTEDCFNKKN